MPMNVSYIEEEERLDLTFEGNLDVSASQAICELCNRVSVNVRYCIVDLAGVERVFDSGIALLQMLHRRMSARGATVLILSDRPEFKEYIPLISHTPRCPPSIGNR